VTFLWHGATDTQNVALFATITRNPIEPLHRLDATNVWYFSARVPIAARFAYRLAVNSPLTTDGPRVGEKLRALQADPLNHTPWACANRVELHTCQSAVELPGAPDQPWVQRRAGTPEGTLWHGTFRSAALNNERSVTIYVPAGYAEGTAANDLLIVFDEGAYLNEVPTPVILDNLIAAHSIRPTIGVFLGNPSEETRMTELRANQVFADMLASELLPWVHERYRVSEDPRRVTLAGSSLGGLMATFAAYRHATQFGNVLCQSGY
jgi:enterochelin esterase-like enzyme